jgi:hypothetical protein
MNTKGANDPLPGSTYHLERNSTIVGRALEESWRMVVSVITACTCVTFHFHGRSDYQSEEMRK